MALFLCLFLRRVCGHPPRQGPGPPVMGVARAGRLPSRLPGTGSRNNPVDECLEIYPRLHRPLDPLPLTAGL